MEISKRSVDPVDLWKNSSCESRDLLEKLEGKPGSSYWTSFSQLSTDDQMKMMSTLIGNWPYNLERRSFRWSTPVQLIASGFSSGLIAHTIAKSAYSHTWADATKVPIAFSSCTSATICLCLTAGVIHQKMFTNEKLCKSCLYWKQTGILLSTGILWPMFCVPLFCHAGSPRLFQPRQISDYFNIVLCGSRPISWHLLTPLVSLSLVVSIATISLQLWSLNRIIFTLEDDVSMLDILVNSPRPMSMYDSLRNKLVDVRKRLPFMKKKPFSDIVAD